MRLVPLVPVFFALLGCASVSPSDPDYADYVHCGGRGSLFGVSEKVRKCMEYQKAVRQARLEAAKRREQAEQEERERRNAEYARRRAEAEEAEKVRQAECGDNYRNLRVGMSLGKAKRCWPHFGLFRLTGEVNRVDGVVSVYEMPFDSTGNLAYAIGVSAIYVMDGKIVGWTR